MTEKEEAALLANVKSVTDRMDIVDKVFKQLKVGQKMVLAFQCGHSGLYFPADYVKEWGRLYGIGLGPHPVSEVLDSDYHTDPPDITKETRSLDQIMHPVGNCFAQVDHMLVEETAFNSASAILEKDDPFMDARAKICRDNQDVHPKSKRPIMRVLWEQKKGIK